MKTSVVVLVIIAVLGVRLIAQERPSNLETLQNRLKGGIAVSPTVPMPVPMDAPINADTYIVGPGDVLAVNIWIDPPISLSLTVTPEGTLIVPTVGEVAVGARSLSEVRRIVLEAIRKKYIAGSPTVTLVSPRSVVVFVQGRVASPGRYVVLASDRVDFAIRTANGEVVAEAGRRAIGSSEEMQRRKIIEESRLIMSERNVMLRRRNGTEQRVDLVRYRATGDDRWNPTLSEGDLVMVPQRDGTYNSIGVYGGVNLPGRYEYVEGETIEEAIGLAGGFSGRAMRDSVVLIRPDSAGRMLYRHPVVWSGDGVGVTGKVVMEPGDRILVLEAREMRGDYHVTIEGEVFRPGLYPITKTGTRLSDVMEMAGGFTPDALLSGAEVYRVPRQPAMVDRGAELVLNLQGVNALEDTVHFRVANALRAEGERVSADLEALFLSGDSTQNIVLGDGDRVVVPSRMKSVYVFGQVVSPGHVAYASNASVEYYVRHAGGYAGEAMTGGVKVVKASSRQWLSPSETTVEDGDAIWVPKEVKKSFSYYMNIIGQAASVASVALSIAILATQLAK